MRRPGLQAVEVFSVRAARRSYRLRFEHLAARISWQLGGRSSEPSNGTLYLMAARDMVALLLGLLVLLPACGAGGGSAGPGADALVPPVTDMPEEASPPPPPMECDQGIHVQALVDCMEGGQGPDACLAALGGGPLCDSDGDGIPDDLESALGRAYGVAFAFNGGAFGGDPETYWPANVRHFASNARVDYRPDGVPPETVVPMADLSSLAAHITVGAGADLRDADDSGAGQGADFWLCLNDATSALLVHTREQMLALPDGVDVTLIVRPANGTLEQSQHYFVWFYLFYAYNSHSVIDDHEGDWEGAGVFVNRQSGAVEAAYFDRHDTTDNVRLVDVRAFPVIDPSQEMPYGDISTDSGPQKGLRFWDSGGLRHHVVAYVATGGHSSYDYPANTYILRGGPRDTHNGDADKLLTWQGQLAGQWGSDQGQALTVRWQEPGEETRIVLPWARFRGQWGCTNEPIAASWPGPFGNARHPRPLFSKAFGAFPAQ
jgi:hypothetical protein